MAEAKTIIIKKRGASFVISAPSGAGKTTLCRELMEKNPDIKLSVSYTTRSPREGEVNDEHYTFITEKKFKGMIDRGEFAEWAVVHGNLYGTSIKRLKKLNDNGYDIILDIDTRGAMQLKENFEKAVYIFIFPPSLEILKKRLVGRKTDTKEIIEKRLNNAKDEMKRYKEYDYVIINDKLKIAYHELESIVTANKLRTENTDDIIIRNLFK